MKRIKWLNRNLFPNEVRNPTYEVWVTLGQQRNQSPREESLTVLGMTFGR